MKFYLPSWNGDFRLEARGPNSDASDLVLVDPTPQERVVVGDFLRVAKRKKWWEGEAPTTGQPYVGADLTISIGAPIAAASKALVKVARPADRTLTAVKFASGKMEVVEGATPTALDEVEAKVAAAAVEEAGLGGKGGKASAASVKRPTPCCPQCLPGAVGPATEVLLSFLTPEQHEQWSRERAILVEGGLSGHRYLLAHRHTPLAQRIGRVCYDVDDQCVVHFHDWSVPPEEEVLAAKLILEHAEPWLRNEATVFLGGRGVVKYKNPFGGFGDGTESASFARGFGSVLAAATGISVAGDLV